MFFLLLANHKHMLYIKEYQISQNKIHLRKEYFIATD